MPTFSVQQLVLRSTAFVYLVAFLGAYHQNRSLVGDHGLLPAELYLKRVAAHFGVARTFALDDASWLADPSTASWSAFRAAPTLFWFAAPGGVDDMLDAVACAGMLIAAATFLTGRANMVLMLLMWALYFSIVSVGQSFYSFGWESQLLETGFVATFLVYPLSVEPLHHVPLVATLAFRWLLFRIMFGAGMIKLRGDSCWRDFTCMQYHYRTQPNPNPLATLFDATPDGFHRFEVWVNHFVEIVAPFICLMPQPAASLGALAQIAFQLVIILSGNLSFLNWLTIVPALSCLSDAGLHWVAQWLPFGQPEVPLRAADTPADMRAAGRGLRWKRRLEAVQWCVIRMIHVSYALVVLWLSVDVVGNLFSTTGGQVMNTSYDWLRLVNTYGNFGSVTRVRNEVIIQGRSQRHPSEWRTYEFACKPGHPHRRPCWVSPYHYRIDWLMWFAAFGQAQQNPWLLHLAHKILAAHHDARARTLLSKLGVEDPFVDSEDHPSAIRMQLVEYQFDSFYQSHPSALLQDTVVSLVTRNRTLPRPYWKRGKSRGMYLGEVDEATMEDYARRAFG